jgi:REP element-mobilizing transposase RayT
VYVFTLHSYRSWSADNPRGFVKHDQGIQLPDADRAEFYESQALQEPVLFDESHKEVIFWIVADACARRSWRLHGIAAEPTHVHILVSWHGFQDWQKIRAKFKNLMSLELGRYFNDSGRHWFSREGSRKRVQDRKHFDHLINAYLPKHRWAWCEGEPLPSKPEPRASAHG